MYARNRQEKIQPRLDDKYTFPQKLYRMLEYADKSPDDVQAIISWQPHGRSFKIKDKKRLQDEVLPLFFATGKYDSFRRNLNHWGFSQIKKVDSPDNKSYYHDYFLRTKMDLTHMIKRVKDPKFTLSRTSVYKYGMPFQEPNFHEMEWLPAQTKKQKEEKKRCYSTSSALSSSSSLRAVSISPAMMSSRSDTGMIVTTTRYNDSHDDMDVDKRNDDLLRPKLSNRENNHHASVNSIIEPASLRIDQLERYYSTESSTIRSFTSSNQERTSFTEINPPLQEEQATNSAAMTSNLDCNEGNIWDDNNWQQFLIEQYMLLPKDLSVLNSVFDHESCLT